VKNDGMGGSGGSGEWLRACGSSRLLRGPLLRLLTIRHDGLADRATCQQQDLRVAVGGRCDLDARRSGGRKLGHVPLLRGLLVRAEERLAAAQWRQVVNRGMPGMGTRMLVKAPAASACDCFWLPMIPSNISVFSFTSPVDVDQDVVVGGHLLHQLVARLQVDIEVDDRGLRLNGARDAAAAARDDLHDGLGAGSAWDGGGRDLLWRHVLVPGRVHLVRLRQVNPDLKSLHRPARHCNNDDSRGMHHNRAVVRWGPRQLLAASWSQLATLAFTRPSFGTPRWASRCARRRAPHP